MENYLYQVKKELEKRDSLIKQLQLDWETSLAIGKGIIKGKLIFIDDSVLHFNEFVSELTSRYRFHYMDDQANLIRRWDSSPHHRELITFPYHLHTPEQTLPSLPVTLVDVLDYIEKNVLVSLNNT